MSGPYWTDTFNPVMGCTECSPGCTNCWARSMHERFHADPFSDVHVLPSVLSKPLRRRKPTTFFVCNTSDLFHPSVPFEFVAAVYGVMAATPHHTYLVLTKRPERRVEFMRWLAKAAHDAAALFPADDLQWRTWHLLRTALSRRDVYVGTPDVTWPLPNVWEGVTVEDQERADERIPVLLDTPAAHRWVSAEPLLGPVDFAGWMYEAQEYAPWGETHTALPLNPSRSLDQIIIGGESGPNARPCDVAWIRSIVRQCKDAGVRCYVKQLGSNALDRAAAVWMPSHNKELHWMAGERHLATVFPSRHWHTWDRDGIGGENWTEDTIEAAQTAAESSVIGQGFGPRLRVTGAGSDPSEWPEDLRVRELGWTL